MEIRWKAKRASAVEEDVLPTGIEEAGATKAHHPRPPRTTRTEQNVSDTDSVLQFTSPLTT